MAAPAPAAGGGEEKTDNDDDDEEEEEVTCWICYDGESAGMLLRSGCACHGACRSVHLRCLVSAADASAYKEDDEFWVACPTCKEMRSGPAQLGLARVRWGLVKSRPDWDYARQSACTEMAVSCIESGDFATAQKFREELLAVDKRNHGDEHPQTVSSLTNYGKMLSMRCEYDKAKEVVEAALKTVEVKCPASALALPFAIHSPAADHCFSRDRAVCRACVLRAACCPRAVLPAVSSLGLDLAARDRNRPCASSLRRRRWPKRSPLIRYPQNHLSSPSRLFQTDLTQTSSGQQSENRKFSGFPGRWLP
jgi:hypothetical protein